jgi:TolA-binding protein
MKQTGRILGLSITWLLLSAVGLFTVCSSQAPRLNTDDRLVTNADLDEAYKKELEEKLRFLDEKAVAAPRGNLADDELAEILDVLGIDKEAQPVRTSGTDPEDFLTDELFLELETEIAQLERLTRSKDQMIDSLRMEIEETEHQLAALRSVTKQVPVASTVTASTVPMVTFASDGVDNYKAAYQDALDDFYTRNYRRAISKFQALLERNTNHDLSDNAQYWIGESYFALGDYYRAIAAFQKVFTFEGANKVDDAQLMIGLSYLKTGDYETARTEFITLLSSYPTSEYVPKAQRFLKSIEARG